MAGDAGFVTKGRAVAAASPERGAQKGLAVLGLCGTRRFGTSTFLVVTGYEDTKTPGTY